MGRFDVKDYWETRLSKNYSLAGVGYLGLGNNYNNWLYKIRSKVFYRNMKFLRDDFSIVDVLDIGSGTGFYIDKWKNLGVNSVVGTDITETAVTELQRRYPHDKFFQVDIGGDITDIEKQRFDIVSAFDVLFHIVDDGNFERAINNIHLILKPGGLFVFSDNFLHGETERSAHQVSRSLLEIEDMLSKARFEIIKRFPMFFFMNYPVDSGGRILKTLWQFMARVVSFNDKIGYLIGFILYPLELCFLSFMKESPSTEIMICKRV